MALLDDRVPWRTVAALGAVFALLAIAGTIGVGPAILGWIGGSIAVVVLGRRATPGASRGPALGEPTAGLPSIALLVQSLPGPSLLVGANDTIVAFNSGAHELLPGLVTGLPVSSATRQPDLLAAIRTARADGAQQRVRYEDRVPIERSIEAVVAPVRAESGGPRHLVVVLRDLTEAARAEQMRADFVANASHELRTPLASLRGYIETLQGPARNDPAARDRFLTIMGSQAMRMTRLIDDLMSLSKIEMREHVAPTERGPIGVFLESVHGYGDVGTRTLAELRELDAGNGERIPTLQELIDLARHIQQASARGTELGLSEDELAFYDALGVNDSAVLSS